MVKSLAGLRSLQGLADAVADIERQVSVNPERTFDITSGHGKTRSFWRDLGEDDRRFLPGKVHLVAPRVACVNDRQRTSADGRSAPTQGVWLGDPVIPLGPMGCKEVELVWEKPSAALVGALDSLDPRFTAPYAAAANPWTALITLDTSQAVLVLLPE
jgi:hypothetical protein